MKLWLKILIALFLGTITGFFIHQGWLPKAASDVLAPVGTIFLNLISMIIVFLILSSMTVGITSIHDPQKLGRVGLGSIALYACTTMLAIAIGIIFAKVFQPGLGLDLTTTNEITIKAAPSVKEMVLSMFPTNPVASLAEGNVLQIIVFSLFLGISINFAGEKGKPLLRVLESLADVMFRLTSIIMEFSPIGVFAIMATVTGTFGFAITSLNEACRNILCCLFVSCSFCLLWNSILLG